MDCTLVYLIAKIFVCEVHWLWVIQADFGTKMCATRDSASEEWYGLSSLRNGNSRKTTTLSRYPAVETRETRMSVINVLFLDWMIVVYYARLHNNCPSARYCTPLFIFVTFSSSVFPDVSAANLTNIQKPQCRLKLCPWKELPRDICIGTMDSDFRSHSFLLIL